MNDYVMVDSSMYYRSYYEDSQSNKDAANDTYDDYFWIITFYASYYHFFS